jgi:hypothetical protein
MIGGPPPVTAAGFIARKAAQFERERDRVSVRTKDIDGGEPGCWVRDAWTLMADAHDLEKVNVVERLRYAGGSPMSLTQVGHISIRFSYFKIGRRGNKAGRWTFGQYAQSAPPMVWRRLFEQAVQDGTILREEFPWLP